MDINTSPSPSLKTISSSLEHDLSSDSVTPKRSTCNQLESLPPTVLLKIISFLPISDILSLRVLNHKMENVVESSHEITNRACFIFDGRKADASGSQVISYLSNWDTKNSLWTSMRIRRGSMRQVIWLTDYIEGHEQQYWLCTDIVTCLQLHNCSFNWTTVLKILLQFPNLTHYSDRQDMYCWDYSTFNAGIEEAESLQDNALFLSLPGREGKEDTTAMKKLRNVLIHRSQLAECTTYTKMLLWRCSSLEKLEVTTDQNFSPQRVVPLFGLIGRLIRQNEDTLTDLKFPYQAVSATYDFRFIEDNHIFREFLTAIVDQQWSTMNLRVLKNLSLQFMIVFAVETEIRTKLIPFLQSLHALENFYMRCVFLEPGHERVVADLLLSPENPFSAQIGIYMNDATGGLPVLGEIIPTIQSISVQSFTSNMWQVAQVLPSLGIESYDSLREFQYFIKNHAFSDFNIDLLTLSCANLTHLNIVDHNARVETRHSSEALATIEDSDMQLIIQNLNHLQCLQLIGNLTFLTDAGLTGITSETCKSMFKQRDFNRIICLNDQYGKPVSNLKNLESIVVRGLGIKVTSVTAFLAFNYMNRLKKLYLYGCHRISPDARGHLAERYPTTKGCDIQM